MRRLAWILILILLLNTGCGVVHEEAAVADTAYVAGEPHLYPTLHGVGILEGNELAAGLTQRQRQLVVGWLDLYYESLATLTLQSSAELFTTDASRWSDRLVDYQIIQRAMQAQDLTLTFFRYTAEVVAAEPTETGVSVELRVDDIQQFTACPGVQSRRFQVWFTFQLAEQNGTWYLTDYMDSFREIYTQRYPEATYEEDYWSGKIDELPDLFALWAEPSLPGEEPACSNPYDRQAAAEYAQAYCISRNSAWADYSEKGGNCQNYVSQCLLAGGIPMDYTDPAQWNSETGGSEIRSPSWAWVQGFAAYAAENTGYGLSAEVDVPYYSGNIGDVLQMGLEENCHHSTVIVGLVQDEQGKTVDYLLNSNTANLQNFPASAYPYPYRSLIRIYGWNE
ncbi:MAG: amidase domain-containing protein [Clostridia bacterium]|nr:amidase domain-containing protein [Clostridia bacterium]